MDWIKSQSIEEYWAERKPTQKVSKAPEPLPDVWASASDKDLNQNKNLLPLMQGEVSSIQDNQRKLMDSYFNKRGKN